MAALRALAELCGFGQMESEMIRYQLIANAYVSAVKEKLLLEEDLMLDKALTITCQVEAVVKNATLLSPASAVPAATVQAVGAENRHFQGKREAKPAKASPPDHCKLASGNRQQRKCFRFGCNKHLANDKNCPAATVNCSNCGRKGHFAKVCKSSVSEVKEVVVPELAVLCVDDVKLAAAKYDKITCYVNIEVPQGNPRSLELIVDTGAAVSILPEKIYRQHFADCPLTASQMKLVTYAKGDLPIRGCRSAEVAIANQDVKVPVLFYIVKAGSPLLGLDLIKALKISIIDGKVSLKDNANAPATNAQPSTVLNIDSTPAHHL